MSKAVTWTMNAGEARRFQSKEEAARAAEGVTVGGKVWGMEVLAKGATSAQGSSGKEAPWHFVRVKVQANDGTTELFML